MSPSHQTCHEQQLLARETALLMVGVHWLACIPDRNTAPTDIQAETKQTTTVLQINIYGVDPMASRTDCRAITSSAGKWQVDAAYLCRYYVCAECHIQQQGQNTSSRLCHAAVYRM